MRRMSSVRTCLRFLRPACFSVSPNTNSWWLLNWFPLGSSLPISRTSYVFYSEYCFITVFFQFHLHQEYSVTVPVFPTPPQRHSTQDQEHSRGHAGDRPGEFSPLELSAHGYGCNWRWIRPSPLYIATVCRGSGHKVTTDMSFYSCVSKGESTLCFQEETLMFSSLTAMEQAEYTFHTTFQDHQYKVTLWETHTHTQQIGDRFLNLFWHLQHAPTATCHRSSISTLSRPPLTLWVRFWGKSVGFIHQKNTLSFIPWTHILFQPAFDRCTWFYDHTWRSFCSQWQKSMRFV